VNGEGRMNCTLKANKESFTARKVIKQNSMVKGKSKYLHKVYSGFFKGVESLFGALSWRELLSERRNFPS